jgi:hypothetical protein
MRQAAGKTNTRKAEKALRRLLKGSACAIDYRSLMIDD